jgi:hypothetical protein
MSEHEDTLFDEEGQPTRRVTNAILATRLYLVEQQVSKLPTNSDVRVLVLAAVVANQLIPHLNIGTTPVGMVLAFAWRMIS